MRPVDRGNLTLTVRRDQGRIKVVVDALDKENQFLNFLQVQGNVVSPDLKRSTIELAQTAPGRYEGTVDEAEASGNYFINLGYRGPDGVQGVISSGVSVPYSDEYRELRSNPATLETVASLTDGQASTWKFRPDGRPDLQRTLDGVDHFRRDANLTRPRGFAPSGPTCSGWPPSSSWPTWRCAGSPPTSTGSASRPPTPGSGSAGPRSRRRANTWRSSRAGRPRSASSSTGPAPPRDSRRLPRRAHPPARPPCPRSPRGRPRPSDARTPLPAGRASPRRRPPRASPRAIPTACSGPSRRSGKSGTRTRFKS